MTMTFDEMAEQVATKADEAINDIIDEGKRIADMLNDAASGFGGWVAGIFSDEVEDAIEKWNNEILPAINDGISQIATEVDKAVDQLAGDPPSLISYANAFADAKTKLYQSGASTMAQEITLLGQSWEGDAFEVYSTVATEQDTALFDLSTALEHGGEQTMNAANKILELWRQLIREFTSFQTDIINLLASATDASKVLSFEAPVILEAIAVIWDKVWAIVDLLLEFMTSQATTDAYSWRTLENGSSGLPQNKWPPIAEGSSDTMNDGGNWSAT